MMDRETPPAISIVVPTLLEAQNIESLVSQVAVSLAGVVPAWEIIIVDDNSRDGTDTICHRLQRKGYPIRLAIRARERGLASAVLHGYVLAKGSVFVTMDADLSHPPAAIPEFYRHIRRGADFVIGSRYMPGGGTDDRWTLYRLLNSKTASLLARPLVTISDPMSGFFAIPRALWERAAPLNPIGYKIALELIVKGRPQHLVEIPIQFRTRRHGRSKLSLKQQLLYLRHLERLYAFRFFHGGAKHNR